MQLGQLRLAATCEASSDASGREGSLDGCGSAKPHLENDSQLCLAD